MAGVKELQEHGLSLSSSRFCMLGKAESEAVVRALGSAVDGDDMVYFLRAVPESG